MATHWYYQLMGQEFGPLSPGELKQKAEAGQITPDTNVRRGNDGPWVLAASVKGLFGGRAPSDRPAAPSASEKPPPLPKQSRQAGVARQRTDALRAKGGPSSQQSPEASSPAAASSGDPRPTVAESGKQPDDAPAATERAARPKARNYPRKGLWICVGVGVQALVILTFCYLAYFPNRYTAGYLGLKDIRNEHLRGKLLLCRSYGAVQADAYYDSSFSNAVIVFDLKDGGADDARRIDPVHLLLQFAVELKGEPYERLVLARNARQLYYINADDAAELAESYDNGERLWALYHVPAMARTFNGRRAYDGAEDEGLAGMLIDATNLNNFVNAWSNG